MDHDSHRSSTSGIGCAARGISQLRALRPTNTHTDPHRFAYTNPAPDPHAHTHPAPATTTLILPDGSTELTDHELGYSLILPEGWFVMELTAEAFEGLARLGAELNPELAPMVEAFASTAPEGTRFMAFDLNPQALQRGYAPSILVQTLGLFGLPLDFLLEATASTLESTIPASQIISHEMIENLNGVPAGRIELRMPMTAATGAQITVRQTMLLAESSGQLLQLVLSCEEGFYSEYAPAFEEIIQSLRVSAP